MSNPNSFEVQVPNKYYNQLLKGAYKAGVSLEDFLDSVLRQYLINSNDRYKVDGEVSDSHIALKMYDRILNNPKVSYTVEEVYYNCKMSTPTMYAVQSWDQRSPESKLVIAGLLRDFILKSIAIPLVCKHLQPGELSTKQNPRETDYIVCMSSGEISNYTNRLVALPHQEVEKSVNRSLDQLGVDKFDMSYRFGIYPTMMNDHCLDRLTKEGVITPAYCNDEVTNGNAAYVDRMDFSEFKDPNFAAEDALLNEAYGEED